ncbi:hypothetical protein EVAR_40652_1 [Eumeta japonica]|uniref:Uncharacterized protein n=1 Tax=Eumeta variegata TaxID=151549 RepID=A0A4C1X2Z8_EUMVA|nr:hypothetical protein EVAR_40652_1 [Eumeta japonica]
MFEIKSQLLKAGTECGRWRQVLGGRADVTSGARRRGPAPGRAMWATCRPAPAPPTAGVPPRSVLIADNYGK